MEAHARPLGHDYRRLTLSRLSNTRWYPLLAFLIDAAGLVLAMWLTAGLVQALKPEALDVRPGALWLGLRLQMLELLGLWAGVALLLGLYRHEGEQSAGSHLFRLVKCVLVFGLAQSAWTFYSNSDAATSSRTVQLAYAGVSLLTLMACHYGALIALAVVPNSWIQGERILVVSAAKRARGIVEEIFSRGGDVVRVVYPEMLQALAANGGSYSSLSGQLGALINRERIQRVVVVSGPELSRAERDACVRIATRMGVPVGNLLDSPEENLHLAVNVAYGLPMVDMHQPRFSRVDHAAKRTFDVVCALTLIVLLSPVLLVAAFLIKVTSRGPVMYRALRVGRGGRHFPCLKFRTMCVEPVDAEELARQNEKDGALFKIRRDPRITSVGRILRRFSIDELPQLFNVVAGHMCLVGPRPLPIEHLDPDGLSRKFPAWAEERARVHPGITGLWQVSGRSDLAFAEATRLDMEYVRDWSLALDIQILLTTPIVVLTGRGAY